MKKNTEAENPCPAYKICLEMGTATSDCLHIDNLLIPNLILKLLKQPDLHNVEEYGDASETFDEVREGYQQTLEDYEQTTASREAIETRRVYMKLAHLQCCLSSIVLLLSRKAN
jgi:hypothetical protein